MSTTTSAAFQVCALLEKMNSNDKDYRFMAVSDLMKDLLEKDIKLDEDSERKISRAILKLLVDKNGEVQNLAVKCLGPLTTRIRDGQIEFLLETLSGRMVAGAEEERDVCSMALKIVVSNLTIPVVSNSVVLIKKLVPKINDALTKTKPTDSVRLEFLDILADCLLRFGGQLGSLHEQTQKILLLQLESERQALRKRATVALGHLSAVIPVDLFNTTVEELLTKLNESKLNSTIRCYIVALTFMAKSSGSRFAKHIETVVPLFSRHLENEDDELKEAVLQAFMTFFTRCPAEISPYQPQLQKMCVQYLTYDPNYCGSDNEEDDSMEVEDDEELEDDGEDYSDDDDMSWKVRRAATKALEAMVLSRRDQLATHLSNVGSVLINRMKEREENVRGDIFNAYIAFLKQTRSMIPNVMAALWTEEDCENEVVVEIGAARFCRGKLSNEQILVLEAINGDSAALIKAVTRQLKNKSVKTRLCCFHLLTELVRVLPHVLFGHLGNLMGGIESNLTDKSGGAQMKMDILTFISAALKSHDEHDFKPYLSSLVKMVIGSINDSFYKVSAEGLAVVIQLVPVLKTANDAQLASELFEAVFVKLKVTDIDQDVKERAISASALFVSIFGSVIGSKLPTILDLFVERLNNEMTRLPTVRAIQEIAAGDSPKVLEPIIDKILPFCAEFLKKNHRALKLSTLQLIQLIISSESIGGVDNNGISEILSVIPALFRDTDLQIAQLALKCLTLLIARFPKRVGEHLPVIIESFIVLLQSALLQGPTLAAALETIRTLVTSQVPGKPKFEELLNQLTVPVYEVPNLPRQAFHSISAVTATVASASNNVVQASNLVRKLADQMQNSASNDQTRLFCIYAIGEMGRNLPAVFDEAKVDPGQLMLDAFNSAHEDLKAAAAQAMGALAIGNLDYFIPFILAQIESEPKRQYLLLHSLKEVIGWETDLQLVPAFSSRIDDIWSVLINNADCSEEGTRNIVAECMGKLGSVSPKTIIPKLKEQLASTSPSVRSCVVTAVKFMISTEKKAIDYDIQDSIGDFLNTIKDSDLNVRRVALVVLNSAAHNKPSLIGDLLPQLLPSVYAETKLRTELIHEVEMGPFKHKVDNGLDLRKSAFECMYTLLDNCHARLDILEFISHVENGLTDQNHDIRLLTYLMLIRLTLLCPGEVLQKLEKICEYSKIQLNERPKVNAVKQEVEKLDELKRASVRAIFLLQTIPEADRQPQFIEVASMLRNVPELKLLSEQVQRDASRTFVEAVAHP